VKDLVKVTAYASGPGGDNTYRPGEPVTLVFHFKIAPEWHIYWLNPGDSGQSTAVKVTFPVPAADADAATKSKLEGWTRGPSELPLPFAIPQPGGLVNYGYEGEAVLVTTVTPPTNATGTLTLTADAVYLVCKDICLPGHQRLSIDLKPALAGGASVEGEAKKVLDRWRERLPGDTEVSAEMKGEPVGEREWARLSASVPVKGTPAKAELFMLVSDEVEYRQVRLEVGGGGGGEAVIKMEAKLYTGTTAVPDTMRGLLVLTDAAGKRTGEWVNLKLPGGKGK
jgi:thiol:disulfide interchange protein DsbD